jgi:acyl-CoA synthetase (AMP-forming)/AMP-acid ligase II
VVLLSIRLSPLAIKSLVVETGASIVYTSQQHMPLAKEAHSLLANEKRHPLSINASRSYRQFLNIGNLGRTRVYVDLHHVADDDRNVFILHSSGTTGLPKAIRQSHSYVLNYLLCCDLSDVESQRLNLTSLPLFHVSVPSRTSSAIGEGS